MKLTFSFLILIFFGASCSELPENRIEIRNSIFYFENQKDYDITKKIATYWKNMDFISSQSQSLKIKSEKNKVNIYIITNQNHQELPFEHQKLFMEIIKDIDSVLNFTKEPIIFICNKRFEPKTSISR